MSPQDMLPYSGPIRFTTSGYIWLPAGCQRQPERIRFFSGCSAHRARTSGGHSFFALWLHLATRGSPELARTILVWRLSGRFLASRRQKGRWALATIFAWSPRNAKASGTVPYFGTLGGSRPVRQEASFRPKSSVVLGGLEDKMPKLQAPQPWLHK